MDSEYSNTSNSKPLSTFPLICAHVYFLSSVFPIKPLVFNTNQDSLLLKLNCPCSPRANLSRFLTILSFKGTPPPNIKNPSQLSKKEDPEIKRNCLQIISNKLAHKSVFCKKRPLPSQYKHLN